MYITHRDFGYPLLVCRQSVLLAGVLALLLPQARITQTFATKYTHLLTLESSRWPETGPAPLW